MNILMVDDQESVVAGLKKGIHWDELKFEHVFTAYCAAEAKEILHSQQIDILLCDIEMPGENGIQLLAWINQNKIDLKCIFLTSHAEFDYAKDALRQGSADYILQPAPYDEIEAAVRKAISSLRSERDKDFIYQYGKYVLQDEEKLRSSALTEMLGRHMERERYQEMGRYVALPEENRICRLVLCHILNFYKDIGDWDEPLLSMILYNISSECFGHDGIRLMETGLEQGSYVMLLYSENADTVDEETMKTEILRIDAILAEHLRSTTAYYCSENFRLTEIADQYEILLKNRKENVSQLPGIYSGRQEETEKDSRDSIIAVNMDRWMKNLQEGYYDPVKDEIFRYFDEACGRGEVTKKLLTVFHFAYMSGYLELLKSRQIAQNSIFDADGTEIYNAATESLEDMKKFIDYTICCLREETEPEKGSEDVVFLVRKYISDNIERDIRRPEIAGYIHLNEDYLTRIFRKETGISLKEYIIREKMLAAQEMIRTTVLPISFIAAKIGYCNYSHFSKIYKKVLGTVPTDDRKNVGK